jgi:hypothetical protein
MPTSFSNESDPIPPSFVIESTENGGIDEVLDQFSTDEDDADADADAGMNRCQQMFRSVCACLYCLLDSFWSALWFFCIIF